MVFYAAFNSISVISWPQLTLLMSFLGFTSTRLGLWSVLPKDTPMKKPRGSCVAQTQDPWITSQTLYHWAMWDHDVTKKQMEKCIGDIHGLGKISTQTKGQHPKHS